MSNKLTDKQKKSLLKNAEILKMTARILEIYADDRTPVAKQINENEIPSLEGVASDLKKQFNI